MSTSSFEALKDIPGTCHEAQHLIAAARKVATGETTLAQVIADMQSPECSLPPPGWKCTRKAGHDGPCAAVPDYDNFPDIIPPESKHLATAGRLLTLYERSAREHLFTATRFDCVICETRDEASGELLGYHLQEVPSPTGPYTSADACEAIIADFNQRLIDRTTGFMRTLGQQALELNHLRTELRQEKEILSAFTEVFDFNPNAHVVPSHTLALAVRQRDQARALIVALQEAFEAARAFIDSHAADPDLTAEMVAAYEIYTQKSASLNSSNPSSSSPSPAASDPPPPVPASQTPCPPEPTTPPGLPSSTGQPPPAAAAA